MNKNKYLPAMPLKSAKKHPESSQISPISCFRLTMSPNSCKTGFNMNIQLFAKRTKKQFPTFPPGGSACGA